MGEKTVLENHGRDVLLETAMKRKHAHDEFSVTATPYWKLHIREKGHNKIFESKSPGGQEQKRTTNKGKMTGWIHG